MSIEQINVGDFANSGRGDDLRTAFQKVNSNFSQISSLVEYKNSINKLNVTTTVSVDVAAGQWNDITIDGLSNIVLTITGFSVPEFLITAENYVLETHVLITKNFNNNTILIVGPDIAINNTSSIAYIHYVSTDRGLTWKIAQVRE